MKVRSVKNKLSFYVLSFLFLSGTEIQAQCYQYVGPDNGTNQASHVQVNDLSLAVDSIGTPYISYQISGVLADEGFVVSKFSSGNWVPLDTGWFHGKIAMYPSVAVDKNGYPAVVYGGLYNKLTVVRHNGVQWDTIGMQGFTAGSCYEPKLVFDNSNTPHVIFIGGASGKISVMKYDGSSWVYVGPPDFSAANSKYLNISVDTAGTLYAAYRDGASNKATVMKFDGSSWIDVGLPGISAGNAWFVTMALDDSGTPYVGYSDSLASKKVSVKKFDGSSWVYVGTQGFSATMSNYHSIAIDPSGIPLISFGEGDATGSSGPATVMKFNGSTWSLVGLRSFSQGSAHSTSLAITSAGTPIIAMIDFFNCGKASVMKFNGSSWASVEKSGISPGLAPYTSMTVDNMGTPYVAFQDMSNGKKASVMYYDGSSWLNVGPPALTTGPAKNIILLHDQSNALYLFYKVDSLAAPKKINVLKYSGGSWTALASPGSTSYEFDARFDPNDNLHVAFSDSAYSHKISVKKYNGSTWSYVGTPGFTSVAAYGPSIDISESGSVYVSYEYGNYLWVASNASGSWLQFTNHVEQYPYYSVIRIGKSGLFVMYAGSTAGGPMKLFQSFWGGWNLITGGGSYSPSNMPLRIDLTLDEFGNQYFAYPYFLSTVDSTKRRLMIMARMNNQIFSLASPSLVNSVGAFNYPNLCFDTLGNLYAGYQDGGAVVQKLNTIRVAPSSVVLQNVCLGDTAQFSLTAYSALPLTYQWQVDMTGGGTYTNLSNDATFSGVNTPSLSIMNVTSSLCADYYRCAISNSCYTYYAKVSLFNATPYISFFSFSPSDTVCLTTTPYVLSGASPPGGTYSGYNVADTLYTADSAGSFAIIYTVTNAYGCTSSDTTFVETVLPTVAVTATEPSCGGTGSLTITGSGTAPFIYELDTVSQASNTFSGILSGINYVACMTDTFGCHACTSIMVADSCDLVWPGDANDDSVANNLDILAIGIGIDSSATARSIVINDWDGYPSFAWPQTLAGGSNYKHIDCNGDGAIDLNDTLAVNQNFSLTHAFSPPPVNSEERLVAADLYFVTATSTFNSGDMVNVEVWAGSSLSPVTDLYGIAFDINYTASLVQPGTEALMFPGSWLGTPGTNAIKISKIDALASTAYGGVSRITHTNASGFGKIADFKFQLKSSIGPNTPMFFSFSGYQANDSVGNLIVFNTVNDSILVNSTSGIEETNVTGFTIAPNPFTSQATVKFDKAVQDATIKITDVLGKEMRTSNFSGDLFIIDKGELQSGIYFVELFSTNRLIGIRKLVIQ